MGSLRHRFELLVGDLEIFALGDLVSLDDLVRRHFLAALGVIGGALTFGFIGVFLGPTLLAVGYRLVSEWASNHRAPASADSLAPNL